LLIIKLKIGVVAGFVKNQFGGGKIKNRPALFVSVGYRRTAEQHRPYKMRQSAYLSACRSALARGEAAAISTPFAF